MKRLMEPLSATFFAFWSLALNCSASLKLQQFAQMNLIIFKYLVRML